MQEKSTFAVVGKSVPAKDAREKVTGTLKYAVDFALPGMLYGKILRSPYSHAIIKKIDASKAMALPGVVGVVTHEDCPDQDWHGVWFNYIGHVFDGRARFIGDEMRGLWTRMHDRHDGPRVTAAPAALMALASWSILKGFCRTVEVLR